MQRSDRGKGGICDEQIPNGNGKLYYHGEIIHSGKFVDGMDENEYAKYVFVRDLPELLGGCLPILGIIIFILWLVF